ncbi:hypothetical protein CLCR_06816 [Cladophialophora carrionii]|uniref:Uncharacterized protein n=1 Tax=Cladophialophora carrionii TaxID=86049 RepID=A0A1C1CPT6_9EURO|nr:hypothetical protein CLCR_06816 [Cladophialophora carrionii]
MAFDMNTVLVIMTSILIWSVFATLLVLSWRPSKRVRKSVDCNSVARRPRSFVSRSLRFHHLNSRFVGPMSPAGTTIKASLSIRVPTSLGFPCVFVTQYLPHNTPQHHASSWALVLAARTSHKDIDISYSHFDSSSGSPPQETQQGLVEDNTFESDVSSNLWLVPAKFDFSSSISEPAEESLASSSSGSPSPLFRFSPHLQEQDTTTTVSSPASTHSYSVLQFERHEQDGVHQHRSLEENLELEDRNRELLAENDALRKTVDTQQRFIATGATRLRKSEVEAEKWKSLAAHDPHAEIERLKSHLEQQDRALHHSRQEIHRLEEVVVDKETEITVLNDVINQFRSGFQQAYDYVQTLLYRFNWLEQHCTNPVAAHEQLANQNLSLQHELQDIERHLEDVQNQNNALLMDRDQLYTLYVARDNDLREAVDEYGQLDVHRHHLEITNAQLEAEKRELKAANTKLKAKKNKAKVANVKRTATFRKVKVEIQAQLKKVDETRKNIIKTCFNKTLDQNKNDECEATKLGEEPQAELRHCQTANKTCDIPSVFPDHSLGPLPFPLPESFFVYRSVEEDGVNEEDEDEEPTTDGGVLDLVRLINMLTIEDELDLIT